MEYTEYHSLAPARPLITRLRSVAHCSTQQPSVPRRRGAHMSVISVTHFKSQHIYQLSRVEMIILCGYLWKCSGWVGVGLKNCSSWVCSHTSFEVVRICFLNRDGKAQNATLLNDKFKQ